MAYDIDRVIKLLTALRSEMAHGIVELRCNDYYWREITAILPTLQKRSDIPCGDCFEFLPLNMECDNQKCVRVIMKNT